MNELALFAGAGGGILGGKLLGWNTICAVERDAYAAAILAQRQNDGLLEAFPIWSDVTTFDGRPWRGIVDVISGGFPCQDISPAGKQAGINGEKSSMWFEMLRIIRAVEPRYVYIENSAHLRSKGLVTVLQGLAEAGYDAAWGILSAKDCGANHERKRMWIVATNTYSAQREGGGLPGGRHSKNSNIGVGDWWKDTPPLDRMDDEVAYRMDRLKATGNGQVPMVAATAFTQLMRSLIDEKETT